MTIVTGVCISVFLGMLYLLVAATAHPTVNADGNEHAQEAITCWTCSNKTSNKDCNDWAPDVPCPHNYTICKTVHRIDTRSGQTVTVNKQCAMTDTCSQTDVGCHRTEQEFVQDCISCCDWSYCNKAVPVNNTSAVDLSTIFNDAVEPLFNEGELLSVLLFGHILANILCKGT